ncbi:MULTISPECIES: Csu type fimbrial protein [Pseudomonas]|uniref:Csu type fimbrial protein n=1 Tax=Pseudomonas TaxID=286 RepID=UPI00257AF728|nr:MULTISPECIES: spore coat U domain-containing protein [Pseudomonas]
MRRLLGGLAVLAWAVPMPLDAALTSTLQVSATIAAGCLVVGGASNYGTLDFGTRPALGAASVNTQLAGTTVTLQCTPGVALKMSVDGGLNNNGVRNLKRTSGTSLVAYQLYRDAALSQALGIGQLVAVSYSDPTAIKLPVYAQAQLPGVLPAGTYTDVVQVVLSW